tara:strand:- start:927 stop:1334 length:408 start_codon:yes stop_codon:yes gene_type:complete
MMQLAANFNFIRQKLLFRALFLGLLVIGFGLYYGYFFWVLSVFLGIFFGYIIFSQLIWTQSNLLNLKQPRHFFIGYITRLCLYSIPVSITLLLKNYLNLYILLVFLLIFQFQYVLLEFFRNYKRYKRRLKNGSIR